MKNGHRKNNHGRCKIAGERAERARLAAGYQGARLGEQPLVHRGPWEANARFVPGVPTGPRNLCEACRKLERGVYFSALVLPKVGQ